MDEAGIERRGIAPARTSFASADAPPALLLHGAEDRTVHPRHSRTLADRLGQAGAEAELRLYPRVGHVGLVTALALPFRRRAPVLADVVAFAAGRRIA